MEIARSNRSRKIDIRRKGKPICLYAIRQFCEDLLRAQPPVLMENRDTIRSCAVNVTARSNLEFAINLLNVNKIRDTNLNCSERWALAFNQRLFIPLLIEISATQIGDGITRSKKAVCVKDATIRKQISRNRFPHDPSLQKKYLEISKTKRLAQLVVQLLRTLRIREFLLVLRSDSTPKEHTA